MSPIPTSFYISMFIVIILTFFIYKIIDVSLDLNIVERIKKYFKNRKTSRLMRQANFKISEFESVKAPLSNSPELYEMKLNQNDLINYVISKELDRLRALATIIDIDIKKLNDKLENLKKEISIKYVEIAKDKFKDWVKSLSNVEFFIDDVYAIGHYTSSQQRYNSYNKSRTPFFISEKGAQEINLNLVLIATEKDKYIGSMSFEFTKSEIELIYKEFRDLSQLANDKYEENKAIQNEIYNIKHNADKVKAKLIEQHLESSEEGKTLLEKLSNIRLSNIDSKQLF